MNKSVYEIKIILREEIFFVKKYFTKTAVLKNYEKLPKEKRIKSYPEVFLTQLNYDEEGNVLSRIILKKSKINLNKMKIDNIKNVLND